MKYLIILLIALFPWNAFARDYTDAIVECPGGFAPALAELVSKGLTEFVVTDEDSGVPIGLKNISIFYPVTPTFASATILYVRGESLSMDRLYNAAPYENINILVIHPAKGVEVAVGMDQEWNTIYRIKDIYETLKEDTEALAIYQGYIYHPEMVSDGTGTGNTIPNPKLQPTIIVDIKGVPTEILNYKYSPFKSMGRFM